LYYADAVDHKNLLGERVMPQFYIDITGVITTKEKMLKCHASQREWLRAHHHIDEYLRKMRAWSAELGEEVGVGYAECYRQHLGHGYPQDNILGKLLGERKRSKPKTKDKEQS
jgi:LmbE family N-acetylglucosaminyl deacetylase